MKKTLLITGFLMIVVVSIFIVGCTKTGTTGGDTLKQAQEVFDSQTVISSEQDAKNVIADNFDKILSGTSDLKTQTDDYILLKRVIDLVGNKWQYNDSTVVFKSCCASGYWTNGGDFNSSKYIVTITSSKSADETIICNDPAEQVLTDAETGKTGSCSSGVKEKQPTSPRLRYIVDTNGKVYFAGASLH